MMISVKSMDKLCVVTKESQSCNYTKEAFVRSGPRCVSITVHLLITSNPKTWLSIVGYSSHDLKIALGGARIIPAVKPMWGLISLVDLTSRAIGFKSPSDDDIPFLAPASPRQTWNCTHSYKLLALLILSRSATQFELFVATSRLLAVYSLQTCGLQKEEQLKHFCSVYWQWLRLCEQWRIQ